MFVCSCQSKCVLKAFVAEPFKLLNQLQNTLSNLLRKRLRFSNSVSARTTGFIANAYWLQSLFENSSSLALCSS